MPPDPGWGHPGGADGWAIPEIRFVEHAPQGRTSLESPCRFVPFLSGMPFPGL